MFNVMKADVNRILKSKSIWIMPILIVLLTAMLSGMFAGVNYVM